MRKKNETLLYVPKNREKYRGDPTNIIARSKWELRVFEFLDNSPTVIAWGSEELVIAYKCKTDGKIHRYYIDLKIWVKDKVLVVEIKPNYQTKPPIKRPNQKQKSYLFECLTYAKNISKWEEAKRYCDRRGWEFQVWDEHTLSKLGIKGIIPLKKLSMKVPK